MGLTVSLHLSYSLRVASGDTHPFGRHTLMAAPPAVVRPRPVRARRNPRWIAVGILAICLGALGSLVLYTQVTTSNTVIAVNRTIMRGEKLQAADLGQVTVGNLAGLKPVAASKLPSLIGQQALTDLPHGSFVVEGSVGTPSEPAGSARVGLRLTPGRVPIAPLPAGTAVRLISVAAPNTSMSSVDVSVSGQIATAPSTAPDGSRVLDVSVPSQHAARIARLAASDQIAVILESR